MEVPMQALNLIVLIMVAVLLSALVSPYIPKVSLPLVQIALGLIWYFLPITPPVNLDDHLYMVLFIAPLLFFEAKETSLKAIRENLASSLSLAVGLVLFSVLATGYSVHALWAAISLPAAFALGATLGPTDAIAVSELKKEVNLTDRQLSILGTESLFNDAASIVSFQFATTAALTGRFSPGGFTRSVIWSFLGGTLIGALLGLGLNRLMLALRRVGLETTTTRITIELLFPLLAYVFAEEIGASGVITVVAAGLMLRYDKIGVGEDIARTNQVSSSVWDFVTFSLNGSVFVLLGLELPLAMKTSLAGSPINLPYLIVTVVLVALVLLTARFLWIQVMTSFSKDPETGRRLGSRAWTGAGLKSSLIMTIGGVKGTISLILAFSLPAGIGLVRGFPIREILLFIAAGYTLLSLVTANLILPLLSPKDDQEEEADLAQANQVLLNRTMSKISSLETNENRRLVSLVLDSYAQRLTRQKDFSSSRLQDEQVKDLHIAMVEFRRQWLENYRVKHPECSYAVSRLLIPIEEGLAMNGKKLRQRTRLRGNLFAVRFRIGKTRLLARLDPKHKRGPAVAEGDPTVAGMTIPLARIQEELTEATIDGLFSMLNQPTRSPYSPAVIAALIKEYQALLLTARRAGHGSGSVPSPSRREDFYDRLSHIKAQAYQLELDTIREMLEGNEISLAQARTLRSNVYIMQSDNSER